MNIATNPWSFTSADIVTSVPTASPNGLVQVSSLTPAAVNLTTTGAHNLVAGNFITVIGTTGGRFVGWYKVLVVPSGTTALLANLSSPTSGLPFNSVLAGDGGGNVYLNQVQQNVRIEDMSWQSPATIGDTMDLRDRNGLPVWSAKAPAIGSQNRGKLYWVDGLTLIQMSSGTILVTIN